MLNQGICQLLAGFNSVARGANCPSTLAIDSKPISWSISLDHVQAQ